MSSSSRARNCASLILSDDTDVFMIMIRHPQFQDLGIEDVLHDTTHSIDKARRLVDKAGLTGESSALVYNLAGSDYLPYIWGRS